MSTLGWAHVYGLSSFKSVASTGSATPASVGTPSAEPAGIIPNGLRSKAVASKHPIYMKLPTKDQHLFASGPKRILALDGGGVRGVLSLAFLERVETLLQSHSGHSDLRLCDYYDLIGGTSTGSLIATGLALGQTVPDLIATYRELCRQVFKAPRWLGGVFIPKFRKEPLLEAIRSQVGQETLGSEKLKTGLAIVTKRLDTGSLWLFHNNPNSAFYEAGANFTPNRDLALTSLLRASTAAPTYFEPELIEIAPGVTGSFIDGGVSPHDNPALLLLMVATISGYGFRWPMGKDRLLLTSVGTGSVPETFDASARKVSPDAMLAIAALRSVLRDCDALVQTLLQWMSNNVTPWTIDSEIGNLSNDHFGDTSHFHYQRYNVVLDADWLSEHLGLDLSPKQVARLVQIDQPDAVEELLEIGRKAAKQQLDLNHFPTQFDFRGEGARLPESG